MKPKIRLNKVLEPIAQKQAPADLCVRLRIKNIGIEFKTFPC